MRDARDLLPAEELLLLALDAEKGRHRTSSGAGPALAGAVLLDLAEAGRLEARDERLLVVPGRTPEPLLLRNALGVLEEDGQARKPRHWVDRLPGRMKPFKKRVAARLVERRALRRDDAEVLGMFSRRRYTQVGPRRAEAVAENGLVGTALDRAVRDVQAGILAAATTAIVASTGADGGGGDDGGGG